MKNEHTEAWWEGYRSKRPKSRNPYAVGQPWLSQHPQNATLEKMKDWTDGWECRFWGETP